MLGAECTAQRTIQQLLAIHSKQGSVLMCICRDELWALVFRLVPTIQCGCKPTAAVGLPIWLYMSTSCWMRRTNKGSI